MKKVISSLAIACISMTFVCYFTSCSNKIVYSKIMFGRGGGVTGKYDDYFLGKNGNVYKKDPALKTFTKIKSLSSKQTKAIFKEVDDNTVVRAVISYKLFE